MFTILIFTAFLALTNCAEIALPQLDGRIVGGSEIPISEAPYTLAFLSNNFQFCGATMISKRFALTAAHCTHGQNITKLYVRGGSEKSFEGGQKVKVININEHPLYLRRTMDYDIATLELEEDLTVGEAVPLATQLPTPGTTCVSSGWGDTTEGGSAPPTILQVELPMASLAVCVGTYGRNSITDRMFCAGGEAGKDTCQGDSGGPLVCNNEIVGVVSWGKGCGRPVIPGVYTNVPTLHDWIVEHSDL